MNQNEPNEERPFKIYKDQCLEECPPGTEEGPNNSCKVCGAFSACPKKCLGGPIKSIDDLSNFKGCTEIIGDLQIQISGGE